jgi:hypothetical protein
MAARKGWGADEFPAVSSAAHRQARESEKIRIPLHWHGAKGVERERATLQEGWPVTLAIHHTRAVICEHRPTPPRLWIITASEVKSWPNDLPSWAHSAAHASLCHDSRDGLLAAVQITLSSSCPLIRRLDDAGCAHGVAAAATRCQILHDPTSRQTCGRVCRPVSGPCRMMS